MITIHPIPALKDNYIWAIIDDATKNVVLVDPGEAQPAIEFIEKNNLNLIYILLTHHHLDHTGGVNEILKKYSVKTFGPGVKNNESPTIPNFLKFKAIPIPGHTLCHTAYLSEQGHVFTGDMLFSAGCGRVFEGTMPMMYESLQKLAALPKETKVYCGHEYTENNLRFANTVEPQNQAIVKRLEEVKQLCQKAKVTLPSTIAIELDTNPFLRCEQANVIAAAELHAGKKLNDPIEVFTVLRQWKDKF